MEQRKPIPEQISELRDICPNNGALMHLGQCLTYKELNERADRFAGYLATRGVEPGGVVAICLERSFDWIVAALGAMRAGAAYVPLDLSWPDSRLCYAVMDSGATVLVAQAEILDRLQVGVCGVDPERDRAKITEKRDPVQRAVDLENLAYVIYTSGSTGVPKGVEVTHANLVHLTQWHRKAFEVTQQDRASHIAGLGFDAAVWEIWPNLCAGATVVLAEEQVRSSPGLLQAWMVRERVTIGFVPTIHASAMIRMQWPAQTALRCFLTGGDALHQRPAVDLPFRVINNYGPTECTVVSTTGLVRASGEQPPPMGYAVDGAWVYLLDEEGRHVPEGVPGEIYVGGAGVARGYRNMEHATTKMFLPDPFSGTPGTRMFRTGDRAMRSANGELQFLGRVDRQVKIRGQRVELDEIGAVLMQHPGIEFATAAMVDKEIVGYLVPRKGGTELTERNLQEYLRQRLPTYMIPAAMVRLEKPPLSTNGKLDLSNLPRPSAANQLARKTEPATVSPVAAKLLRITRKLLEDETIGPADNFFLAGGHSLLGMQLVMSLEGEFGVKIALQQLFESPTVAELAAQIEIMQCESRIATAWKAVLGLDSVRSDDDFFSLGGNPRLATAACQRITNESGEPMTEAEFNSNPTIRRQVDLIVGRRRASHTLPPGMLPLRPLGSKTKIFWVHYLNANLARKIGDDQPFFSVTLTAEDVRALGASPTLERIGACMVNKIRVVQPEGPYILGGLCLGGVLAYEMASQLRAAGEEIRLLVVIDPPNPSNTRDHGSLARRWSYLRYLIKRAEWLGPRTTLLYSMEKLINTLPWQWWNHLSVGKVHMAQELVETAVYFYRPRACKGPVLLLLASEQLPHTNTLARWQAIVPRDLYTEYVDAYHRELMEPDNASRIAEAIISRLAALEAAPSTQLESSSAAATEIRNGGAVDLGLALQE